MLFRNSVIFMISSIMLFNIRDSVSTAFILASLSKVDDAKLLINLSTLSFILHLLHVFVQHPM